MAEVITVTGDDETRPSEGKLGLFERAGRFSAKLALRLATMADRQSSEEVLDEATLQRIEAIEERWRYDAEYGFVHKSKDQTIENERSIVECFIEGDYEEVELLIPDIRNLIAEDKVLLDPESEIFDERKAQYYLAGLAYRNFQTFFKEYYKHMPRFADSIRSVIKELMIELAHALRDDGYSSSYRETAISLIDAESALPEEIAEEFKSSVLSEVAEVASRGCGDSSYAIEWLHWLDKHGFAPEHWPRDARDRKDFPEPLRRMVNEQDSDKVEELDRRIIQHCIMKTESCNKNDDEFEVDTDERCRLLREYFEGRLPELCYNGDMVASGIEEMVAGSSSDSIYRQVDRYNNYLRTIREIGYVNANKLFEELGITHFADWNPETLQGTLHILETGRTESGNPVTIIIRGSSGDHNNAAGFFRDVISRDALAIEVRHTDDLSGIVEQLKRVGVTGDTFDTVVLFGHGYEDEFVMSSTEKISPDPDEWYGKKGMRDLMRDLRPKRLQLISCHPLVREEDKFEPLTIGEGELQRRKGTAPALSVAFSVPVESGFDGEVSACVNNEGEGIEILTWYKDDDEDRTLETVITRYGLTRRKGANE